MSRHYLQCRSRQHGFYLKALARVSRLLKDTEFRARLRDEADPSRLWDLILARDQGMVGEV